jgi:hypothetical protein
MKLSENYTIGAGFAASVLQEGLLSLLIVKGIVSRAEAFDLVDSSLLSLEQLQAHFAALPRRQQFEDHLKAARCRFEEMRITLNKRHPQYPLQD